MTGESPSNADKIVSEKKDEPPSSSMLKAFALGSISSSCCAIQLVLNMVSSLGCMTLGFGCAGFNTILGPLRPVTRSMTLAWLVWNWFSSAPSLPSKCCREKRPKRRIFESVLCLALMFSPEILTFYGNYTRGDLLLLSKTIEADRENIIRIEYVVDNMGCEACINAVERLISGRVGVAKTSVTSFDTGEIEIYVEEKQWDGLRKKTFEEDLDHILQEHGYELHEKGWVTKKMKMSDNEFSVAGL